MSEKMDFEIVKGWKSFKDFLRTIVDTVVEVKDSVGRRMGDKNISLRGYIGIVAALAVGHAITHEHRDAVKFQTVNLNSGIAQVMHIIVKTVDVRSIQTLIVIAADEYLMAIREVAKPVEKVNRLLLATNHAEITGMYHHICIR